MVTGITGTNGDVEEINTYFTMLGFRGFYYLIRRNFPADKFSRTSIKVRY